MDDVSANLQYVEVRLLRYAIAVAEELHFGRAAQRLHLSAPTLSKQIRQLERSLGYTLFVRRTREVVLTQGGIASGTAQCAPVLTFTWRRSLTDAASDAMHGERTPPVKLTVAARARFPT